MRVRFWGTRGSIAKPGPTTLQYGGNTSCVEVVTDGGTTVVVDCGTGAHPLGNALLAEGRAGRGHLLITHTHWDHIQGFPFFAPLFGAGGEWDIYAPAVGTEHIKDCIGNQMSYDFHPITVDNLEATVRFHDLTEGEFEIDDIRVTTRYLNHPVLTLGYRLEADGVVFVYASDHEPHSIHPVDGHPGQRPIHHEDQRHLEFVEDADLLIHDAQYLLAEYPEKEGWGHTPVERAVDYAMAARVQRLALHHHDPGRSDAELAEIEAASRKRAAAGEHTPDVFAASEGQVVELQPRADRVPSTRSSLGPALLSDVALQPATVLIVEDDEVTAEMLRASLEPECARLLIAGDGETALEIARMERPTLMLLDLSLPGIDGFEVCKQLRADADPALRDMPILMLTASYLTESDVVDSFVIGATDFMTKPIKSTLLRARVRGWIMRSRSRA